MTEKKKRSKKSLTEDIKLDSSKAITLKEPDEQQGLSILPVLAFIPQLEPFKERATELEEMQTRAVIDSEETYNKGSDYEAICQQNWDQLETWRKSVKGPVDDYAKLIQTIFVPLQNRFKGQKTEMNTKRLTFHKAEQKRLADAAAAVQKANEEAMLKLAGEVEEAGDAKGAAAILDAAAAAPVSLPAVRIGGSNSFGQSSSLAARWVGTVENPFEVLGAIITGKIPISVLEWKPAELNKIAAKIKVEGIHNGIKVSKSESLSNR